MKIIIFTCDKYARYVPIFYHFWKKNWPDCPYPLVIVAGKKKINLPEDPQVSIIYQGEDHGYASNAIQFLSNLPDELCLLMQEDFIIHSVQTVLVLRAERLCTRPDIGCVRLITLPGPDLPFDEPDGQGFGEIDKPNAIWVFSMQAAVWKRKLFMSLLREGDTPWQAEHAGTARAQRRPERFLCSEERVLDYEQYCTLGQDIASAVLWVREHWDDPPREPSVKAPPRLTQEVVTVHMMVQNEEFWIGYILNALTKYMPNILIFDTGSTDSTIDIIRGFSHPVLVEKGKLNPQELCECRNEMMEMTETPWVLQVDGDEFYPLSSIVALVGRAMPTGKKLGFTRFLDVDWDGKNFRAYPPFNRAAVLAQEARYSDTIAGHGYPFEAPDLFQDNRLFHYLGDDVLGYHLHHLARSSQDAEVYLRKQKQHQFSMRDKDIALGEVLEIPFGELRWPNPYLRP